MLPNVGTIKSQVQLQTNNDDVIEEVVRLDESEEEGADELEESDDKENETILPESASIIDKVLTRSNLLRSKVSKNQDKAAKTMLKKHDHKRNKRTVEFSVGDSVSVMKPRIDRGSSDLPRLPGIVSAVSGEFYTIVTKYGILANKLRSGDLELYNGHSISITNSLQRPFP